MVAKGKDPVEALRGVAFWWNVKHDGISSMSPGEAGCLGQAEQRGVTRGNSPLLLTLPVWWPVQEARVRASCICL